MQIRINLDDIFTKSHFNKEQINQDEKPTSESFDEQFSQVSTKRLNHKIVNIFHDQQSNLDCSTYIHSDKNMKYIEKEKYPGERLYYLNKIQKMKKMKQYERIKQQRILKEKEELQHTPKINQHSIKLLQQKKNRKQNKKTNKNKQQQIVPTYIRRQNEQLKKCTFKPIINEQSKLRKNPHQQVFENLFNDHKIHQMRKKMMRSEQQSPQQTKKITKKQFDQFIQRNDKLLQKNAMRMQQQEYQSPKFFKQSFSTFIQSPKTKKHEANDNYYTVSSANTSEFKVFPEQKSIFNKKIHIENEQFIKEFKLYNKINECTEQKANQIQNKEKTTFIEYNNIDTNEKDSYEHDDIHEIN